MKKIFTFVAIIFISGSVFSQEKNDDSKDEHSDSRKELLFGMKAGLNYSNVYDSKGEGFAADPKLGFAGGIFLAIPLGKYLGIQPELLFSQKGFQGVGTILGSSYFITRTTNYIDVPLFLAFKPVEFVSLFAGPQYSYLTSQKDAFKNATTTIEQEKEFDNDNIRRNTLCLVIGADINLKHFVISGRAGWDLQNNNGDGTTTTPRYKNIWYQATLGYRFYNNHN